MYQVSSSTGMRHAVDADMPSNLSAVNMLRGQDLPTAKCGREIKPVNFYEPTEKPNPRYQCARCFTSRV